MLCSDSKHRKVESVVTVKLHACVLVPPSPPPPLPSQTKVFQINTLMIWISNSFHFFFTLEVEVLCLRKKWRSHKLLRYSFLLRQWVTVPFFPVLLSKTLFKPKTIWLCFLFCWGWWNGAVRMARRERSHNILMNSFLLSTKPIFEHCVAQQV